VLSVYSSQFRFLSRWVCARFGNDWNSASVAISLKPFHQLKSSWFKWSFLCETCIFNLLFSAAEKTVTRMTWNSTIKNPLESKRSFRTHFCPSNFTFVSEWTNVSYGDTKSKLLTRTLLELIQSFWFKKLEIGNKKLLNFCTAALDLFYPPSCDQLIYLWSININESKSDSNIVAIYSILNDKNIRMNEASFG